MNLKPYCVAALCFFASTGFSKNLGNYGEVFPVIEEDIRQVITGRLKAMEASGVLAQHQKIVEARIVKEVVRPKPLALTETTSPKSYYVDPSVVVRRDIFTKEGVLLAKAGTRLNPFERVALTETLFFFNADAPKQMAWVKAHYQDYQFVKFILTGGDVRDTAEILGRIYFDQGGILSQRLQIEHVPAVVTQEGLQWKITEIGVNDV